MLSASSPYFLISSTAGPDSPNVSITPIFRTGVGSFSESTSHTALPSPPITECSSTVTTFPVSFAAATISSSSIGLIVWILITSHRFRLLQAFQLLQEIRSLQVLLQRLLHLYLREVRFLFRSRTYNPDYH